MRVRLCASLLLGMLSTGCGPLRADAEWVQWFSYRQIGDMAVTPSGDTVVVGRTTHDERVTGAPYGQYTYRPWFARLSADGALLDEWTGFLGTAAAVAVDDSGRAYVSLYGLREDQDWATRSTCELRALEVDGSLRWTQRWVDETSTRCPGQVLVSADTLLVRLSGSVEAFDLDGAPRWQLELPPEASLSSALSARDGAVWFSYQATVEDDQVPRAWRIDARTGQHEEIDLHLGGEDLRPSRLQPTGSGLLMLAAPVVVPGMFIEEAVLFSLGSDGKRRWRSDEPRPETPGWGLEAMGVFTDGTVPWILGVEKKKTDPEPDPEQGWGEERRIVLERWTADGEFDGAARRSFVEAHHDRPLDATPAEVARAECPQTDVGQGLQFGSRPITAHIRGEDTVMLSGFQGCRDSFLVRLEVR